MSISDIEHFSNMVSGCESISSGRLNDPDVKYAFAVLKLHNQDMGLVSGQEGFLDSIKKGASNAVKWVKQLILAIGNWIKNTFLKLIGKGPKTKMEVSKENGTNLLVPALERALEKLKDIKEFEVNSVIDDLGKYITAASKGGDLSSHNEKVVSGIRSITEKVEKKISSLKEGNEENNQEASKLGTDLKKLADAGISIYTGTNKAISGGEWKPNKNLVNSVAIGGSRARAAVRAEIEDNHLSIDELKKSIKYAEEKVHDLYQPYVESTLEGPINKDRSSWTKETYKAASSYVTMNFSKERVKNIVDMYEYLREKGVKGFEKVG